MWKANASRTGTTLEQLPEKLSLLWSRELPHKKMAWPNETRLQYDSAHEPIVYSTRMFMSFPDDGSVRSYDTKTGQQNWVFHANGPIRFSPVAYQDNILVGSDDGFLYCINSITGKLKWKTSGTPADRSHQYHLGNQKLISYWPVRGGPVIQDGIVYFGAGIWPSMGVFIHAVDIKTGKILWTNRKSHDLKKIRIDHNMKRDIGLSPQGYFLLSGDTLLVPNGRSMPAGLNHKDGSFLFYVQGYRNGDSRVITTDEFAIVGETGAISLKDGREIGSRWTSAGKNAPKGADYSKVELFEGPLFPYHSVPGLSFRSVIDQGTAYGLHQGIVHAYKLSENKIKLKDHEHNKRNLKTAEWKIPELWNFKIQFNNISKLTKLKNNVTIKAGNHLISHIGPELFALQIPSSQNKTPKLLWHKSLESTVTSIVAADKKLFVSTSANNIHVYGDEKSNFTKAVHSKPNRPKSSISSKSVSPSAREYLKQTKVTDGYVLILGLKQGYLIEDFLKNTKMKVITVDSNESLINQLRDKYRFDKAVNSRFQAFVGDPAKMEFPPFIANLIITESNLSELFQTKSLKLQYDSLRPYGGSIIYHSTNTTKIDSIIKTVQSLLLSKASINNSKNWLTIQRKGALKGSADWTHETGNASRNYYSHDELVKSPLAILWYGDAPGYGFYKKKDYAHGVKPQVAGGKLFALQGFSNRLFAIDIYTGWQSWSIKVPSSARYASFPEKIYLASGKQCDIIDTQTGNIVKTYPFELPDLENIKTSATDIRVDKNIILIGIRNNKENAISKGRWNNHTLIAINQITGKQVWKRDAEYRYNTAALAMADNMVFCIDSPSYMKLEKMKRRGESIDHFKTTLYTLDANTGEVIWKKALTIQPAKLNSLHFLGLRIKDDWLAYSQEQKTLLAGKGNEIFAFEGGSGKERWKKKQLGQQPLIVQDKTFFNQGGQQFDILTGTNISGKKFFERGGCNYAVGGKHLLFLRNYCASFIDSTTGKQQSIKNLRTGCSNSFVAADGLLTMPCFSSGCICNYPLQTSFSMFHLEEMNTWPESQSEVSQ